MTIGSIWNKIKVGISLQNYIQLVLMFIWGMIGIALIRESVSSNVFVGVFYYAISCGCLYIALS